MPEYALTGIVALDVDRIGNIYVLLASDNLIRVYSPSGRYLRSIGSPGSGPGEFREPAGMTIVGDSLVVAYDRTLRKLVSFDLGGRLRETVPIDIGPVLNGLVRSIAAVDANSFVFELFRGYSAPPRPGFDGTGVLLRVRRDGAILDTLASFRGRDMIAAAKPGGRYPLVFPAPFARAPFWDVSPDGRIAFGRSDQYEITEYDKGGGLDRVLRRETPARKVTPQDQGVYRERFPWGEGLDAVPLEMRPVAEAVLRGLDVPATWPAFEGIRFDTAGRLWVRHPSGYDDLISRWDVFDQELQYLGAVLVPASLAVQKITDTAVYGVVKDGDGVPYMKRYRILKTE